MFRTWPFTLRQSKGVRPLGERGVALLTVIIVVALLTIAVTEFTYSVQLDAHRARNSLYRIQAALLARSGINLAESFLSLDEEPAFDAFTEEWWLQFNQFCQDLALNPGTQMHCQVEDESGKININQTRLSQASLEQQRGQRITPDAFLRDAVRQLFENRQILLGIGGDVGDRLEEYWAQEPPSDDQNRPSAVADFASLEDFAATFQIPTRHLRSLRRVLTAQRREYQRAININTAPAEVLAAILPDAPEAVAAILDRQQNRDEPFRSAGEISGLLQEQGVEESATIGRLFDVKSRLYRLRADGVANVDPSAPDGGGIGQTLSVLVQRSVGQRRPGSEAPGWTLKPLDWQKEGGAQLLKRSLDELDATAPTDELGALGAGALDE
jgi:general secretion pathway protein K